MLDCVLLPDVISTLFPSMIPGSKGRRSITNSVTKTNLVDNIPHSSQRPSPNQDYRATRVLEHSAIASLCPSP